jgi:hypothetical protein
MLERAASIRACVLNGGAERTHAQSPSFQNIIYYIN